MSFHVVALRRQCLQITYVDAIQYYRLDLLDVGIRDRHQGRQLLYALVLLVEVERMLS